jgi:guanylate kinase
MSEHTKRPLRVFLCHASDDKEKIRVLYNNLIEQDIDVWLDEENLLPGQHWQNEIPAAVYASDVIIVCLSKNVITKEGYVQKEIRYALDAAKEKPDGTIFLIPVKLEECDVPKQLSHLQWGNLFYKSGSFDEKDYKRLERSLNARAVSAGAELPKDAPIQSKLDFRYDIYRPKPLLIVISGPSGAGKDSVVTMMKVAEPEYHYVITVTTREQRQHEVNGEDYFFLSKDEFAHMIEQDELIEYAIVYGDYKGLPKSQVRDAIAHGKDVIMRLDVQGAMTVRKLAPEAILIFLTTKNEDELINRLKARKTETPDSLNLRIATARKELERLEAFDYLVINNEGHLDNAVNMIRAIIQVEHHRVSHRKITL